MILGKLTWKFCLFLVHALFFFLSTPLHRIQHCEVIVRHVVSAYKLTLTGFHLLPFCSIVSIHPSLVANAFLHESPDKIHTRSGKHLNHFLFLLLLHLSLKGTHNKVLFLFSWIKFFHSRVSSILFPLPYPAIILYLLETIFQNL